jgi:dihydrodipicolinate synthase/N-acetylneuraminate lyase
MNNKETANNAIKLEGPVYPLVTPFKDVEGHIKPIDYDALNGYIEFLLDGGASSIMVASATSRFAQLSEPEIIELNQKVVEMVSGRAVVIASTPILGSTASHIQVAQAAELSGADLIACEYPWRYQDDDALLGYFKSIVDNTNNISIMMHVTPGRSEVQTEFGKNYRFGLAVLSDICQLDRVSGMKEASGDPQHSRNIWDELANKTGIIVAGNASETFLEAYEFGASGFFVGTGNIDPKSSIDIYNLVLNGEIAKARSLVANKETPFLRLAKQFGWHASLKAALFEMGLMEITEREPMIPVSNTQKESLVEAMKISGWI